jgi:hypothetical protein
MSAPKADIDRRLTGGSEPDALFTVDGSDQRDSNPIMLKRATGKKSLLKSICMPMAFAAGE